MVHAKDLNTKILSSPWIWLAVAITWVVAQCIAPQSDFQLVVWR